MGCLSTSFAWQVRPSGATCISVPVSTATSFADASQRDGCPDTSSIGQRLLLVEHFVRSAARPEYACCVGQLCVAVQALCSLGRFDHRGPPASHCPSRRPLASFTEASRRERRSEHGLCARVASDHLGRSARVAVLVLRLLGRFSCRGPPAFICPPRRQLASPKLVNAAAFPSARSVSQRVVLSEGFVCSAGSAISDHLYLFARLDAGSFRRS